MATSSSAVVKTSVVMPDGVLSRTEEGVPQGGPLSPLLSNIVLDELDQEVDRRGHRFVRYADDVAIFVQSERSGERVMQRVTRFIEGRMRLLVNRQKSSVRRPEEGNFLGFRLVIVPGDRPKVHLSDRTMKRALARLRELTPRNWGASLVSCITRVNRYLQGWFGYFGICSLEARRSLLKLDGRLRRRLRAIQLKHWKRKRTIMRKLNRMKRSKAVARHVYGGRRGWWALSYSPVVHHRLNNQWFRNKGLKALVERQQERELARVAPAQPSFQWG